MINKKLIEIVKIGFSTIFIIIILYVMMVIAYVIDQYLMSR